MSDVQTTMHERGSRYGDFTDVADTAQGLQEVMRETKGWERLNPVQRQALTAIADKIGRILSGDPHYADNWHDIQGYARLVEERLTPPVSQRDEAEFPLVAVWPAADTASETVSRLLSMAHSDIQVVSFHWPHQFPVAPTRMTWQDVAKLSAVHRVFIRGIKSESGLWFEVKSSDNKTTGVFVQRGDVDFMVVGDCDGHKADA